MRTAVLHNKACLHVKWKANVAGVLDRLPSSDKRVRSWAMYSTIGIKVVSIARKPTTGVGIGGFDSCRGHHISEAHDPLLAHREMWISCNLCCATSRAQPRALYRQETGTPSRTPCPLGQGASLRDLGVR